MKIYRDNGGIDRRRYERKQRLERELDSKQFQLLVEDRSDTVIKETVSHGRVVEYYKQGHLLGIAVERNTKANRYVQSLDANPIPQRLSVKPFIFE